MSLPHISSNHQEREKKWSAFWEEQGYASSIPQKGKIPYAMVLPPPNVTGILHMGHVLNGTVQDVLIRKARMEGKEACWVPGTDHASIATEAKVVTHLQARGMSKQKLGREKFLQEAWDWKEKHEKIIVQQLKRLGLSCDWKRHTFTLDEVCTRAVQETFVRLHEEGYIYRGTRMIHWDPQGQTALSDEEVLYREVPGKLYHIAYPVVGSEERLTVATTRPETLLGDAALAVHPEDRRYQAFHGKKAQVPLLGREIPIIADAHVDPAFGTGVLKVTPAHDFHDHALGKRHRLEAINILAPDGKLTESTGSYAGLTCMEARKKIAEDLVKSGSLRDTKPHVHKVGFSERTAARAEPRCTTQWFVRMKALAAPALAAVKKGDIRFHPAKFVNTYLAWLEKIQEWCISRQLWWGHRIPAYFLPDGSYVVAASPAAALQKAKAQQGKANLTPDQLKQDEDVLDTWFSSWLWPLAVFDGILQPENREINYYYPAESLVTAPEIIFFWVARMIMAGYYFKGAPPFKHVYFTGIVRDAKRRKMSKSLGNSPDPLALMDKYGADGVRAGILFSSSAGNDLLFEEKLCQQGHQFVHKIYHAYSLLRQWHPAEMAPTPLQQEAVAWFHARYHAARKSVEDHFQHFRLAEALLTLYKLVRDEFCAHYLELIKPPTTKTMARATWEATAAFFRDLMKLLHPFMPFITEEIWQNLGRASGSPSIMVAPWPRRASWDATILAEGEKAFSLLKKLRDQRKRTPWAREKAPTLFWKGHQRRAFTTFLQDYLFQQGLVQAIVHRPQGTPSPHAFTLGGYTFWLDGLEKKASPGRLHEGEWVRQKQFLARITEQLANPAFLRHAPEAVIARERKKQEDIRKKLEALEALRRK